MTSSKFLKMFLYCKKCSYINIRNKNILFLKKCSYIQPCIKLYKQQAFCASISAIKMDQLRLILNCHLKQT